MTWQKRDPVSNLVILGDAEGNVQAVGGLLASVKQDRMYPANMNYELVQKSGESIVLAGSASLSRQISPQDVGKFVKAKFLGWGSSRNGKFKNIEVNIWEGAATDDMKKWPRFSELHGQQRAESGPGMEQDAPVPDDPEDDLPF